MFENATLLTTDWLRNEMDFELKGTEIFVKEKAKDYYINICALIQRNHFLCLTPAQVEEYIENGEYTYTSKSLNSVTITTDFDKDTRVYLFKRAQAKQLIFDMNNGRAAMIRGVGGSICADTIVILRQLGLYKPSQLLD